jgi:multisubunit Na+/H+ antiporter MnhE subunit
LILIGASVINAVIWFGLTARFDAAALILGFLVVLSGGRLMGLLIGDRGGERLSHLPVRTFRLLNYFLLRVLPSTLQDTWTVMRYSLLRHARPAPAVIAVRMPDATPGGLFLLSYSLTLSPGNQVIEVDEDARTLYVHALDAPDPDALREELHDQYANFIKGIME